MQANLEDTVEDNDALYQEIFLNLSMLIQVDRSISKT